MYSTVGVWRTHDDVKAEHRDLQAAEDLQAELELEAAASGRRAHGWLSGGATVRRCSLFFARVARSHAFTRA